MHIILASGSPRRKELLSHLGIDFDIVVPDIDEQILAGESPEEFCCRVSCDKAICVANDYPESLVIAADTIV